VQVLSRAPIRRVKQAGSCTRWLTDGCPPAAWPSSGPLSAKYRGSHVACLVGLNPTMIREGRERSTRSASANIGR